ncbi:DUF6442 family protein [Anaerococcus porci]|uniref:DUF6442 family protein n=1 Tax=Anaerococcus porci TaxID=2652269 RepID=UPI002A7563A4|nr:DUF6442 family protein [Anaerococcus porci]MDY3006514.1 DUF6442 family protein [Anaerococcus porci]
MTALIFAIEAFFFNSFNYAIIGVYLAMEATRYLFKYSKMKERKELFFGIISGIVGFLVIVGYFFVSFK